eukprot:Selendium_serpulae@DN5575_c0_g3_i1.p1
MKPVGLKLCSNVDLKTPITKSITEQYGRDRCDAVRGQLEDLDAARKRLTSGLVSGPMTESSLSEYHSQYLGRLLLMEDRRLMGAKSGGKILFSWNDSFKQKKVFKAPSFALEKGAVAYNIAALHSRLGVSIERVSADATKEARSHFQRAASVFALIRKDISPQLSQSGVATNDLSDRALTVNLFHMRALAQLCLYEQVKDRADCNFSMKGKLAAVVAEHFSAALAGLQRRGPLLTRRRLLP